VRVLVVEDDVRMGDYIARALIEETMAVDLARDGLRGLELAETYEYDAIVLDIMLPGLDGYSVCERLRDRGVPARVIMVSGRDRVQDRVRGFDAGADDYLCKPFAIEELVARLHALHRRDRRCARKVRVGDLVLDCSIRSVRRGQDVIALTQKEYAFLEYLMRNPGLVLTRTMIAEHVWDFSFDLASNVVDVYVRHLRAKIDRPGRPSYIQAVRGAGYIFRDPGALPVGAEVLEKPAGRTPPGPD
jgi:DNA-binding response OmpR family regulator